MNKSLSHLVHRFDQATLPNTDQEHTHFSGLVPKECAMLVLDPQSQTILGASENIKLISGFPAFALLGADLMHSFPEVARELENLDQADAVGQMVLDATVDVAGQAYELLTYVHAGHRFIEFIPGRHVPTSVVRKRTRLRSTAYMEIMNAPDFDAACEVAAKTARKITECDSVTIHRFLPDWSGYVCAEDRAGFMPSTLGLHFPATEMPAHVREFVKVAPFRFIGTGSDKIVPIRVLHSGAGTLNPIRALSRSVSDMHTAYLDRAGVRSAFLCSLKSKDTLWGMISCHTLEEQIIGVDSLNLVQQIGTALIMRLDQNNRYATASMMTSVRQIENDFGTALSNQGDVEEAIVCMMPALRKFLRADGFAFQYRDRLHTAGKTPPDDFVRKLISWSQMGFDDNDLLQTTSLRNVFPEAADHLATACGVMIKPIAISRDCHLIWFRGPIPHQIGGARWSDERQNGSSRSGGLTSFYGPVHERRDQSLPWAATELEMAREIFQGFFNILSAQVLLHEENETLRQFAYAAAHDIKAPLRGIKFALDWMKEDGFEPTSVEEYQAIASVSALKLERLTDALIQLSLLNANDYEMTHFDMNAAFADARDLLAIDLQNVGACVSVGALPGVYGNADLVTRLLLNLLSNALKYRSADRELVIEVTQISKSPIRIAFTDNGSGIDPKYAHSVFEPTKRLVSDAEVEGSGLGLSICRRIMDVHKGQIELDLDHYDGTRFILTFPAEQ